MVCSAFPRVLGFIVVDVGDVDCEWTGLEVNDNPPIWRCLELPGVNRRFGPPDRSNSGSTWTGGYYTPQSVGGERVPIVQHL